MILFSWRYKQQNSKMPYLMNSVPSKRDYDMSQSSIMDKSITGDKFRSSGGEAPTYVLQFEGPITGVFFSPHILSHDLICITFPSRLIVAQIKFKEEDNEQENEISFNKIHDVGFISSPIHVSWSPITNLKTAPKSFLLAFSHHFNQMSTLYSNDSEFFVKPLKNYHTDYINDFSYNFSGELMASVSNDLTCLIHLVRNNYEIISKFYLRSPGMAVKWHHEEPGKLLVGEKNGTITFYNIASETTILAVRSLHTPLISVDWCLANCQYVAAISDQYLNVWNVQSPSTPILDRVMYSSNATKVLFQPSSENKIYTLGAHDCTIKKVTLNSPFSSVVGSMKCSPGLSIHRNLPYICSAEDSNVCIWRIN